jgi:hypothetical protein
VQYEDFHGAFVADLSGVHDWLNKDEEDFRYQNLTKEKIAQQAEENDSSEEMRKMRRRNTCKVHIFRSETKLRLHH